ncbi:MAG: Bro-N domain-containing protein, partial [Paludibacteraceae bacterium]|nr:Bro-N domain-containing protein [Paludibacteraceae bacterium]
MNGEIYFVGKDVALALGYKNTKDALKRHVDEEDRKGSGIATPLGMQQAIVINESGLYSLILSSKIESARRFKRWITNEV